MSDINFVTIRVEVGPTAPPLEPTINGVAHRIPFNTDHEVPEHLLSVLRDANVHFEIVSRRDVVAAAGETSEAAAAGGTGGGLATDTNGPAQGSEPATIVSPEQDASGSESGETSEAAADHGQESPAPDPADHGDLLKLLDQNIATITAKLPGLTLDALRALLAGEEAGKTRVTLTAAINAEIAARARPAE